MQGKYEKQEELIYWPAFPLMAIPHEVGHFVYHHAETTENGQSFAEMTEGFIANQKESATQLLAHWCEEIFADVYGCFVAGPLSAMGMQALLASSSEKSLSQDDGEHPVSLLRPFIMSEILRVLTKEDSSRFNFQTVPDKLDENWKKILQLRGHMVDNQEDFRIQINGQTTTYSNILEAVRLIIDFYIQRLMENEQKTNTDKDMIPTKIPWSIYDADLKYYDEEMESVIESATTEKFPNHSVNLIKNPSFRPQEDDNSNDKAIEEIFDRVEEQQELAREEARQKEEARLEAERLAAEHAEAAQLATEYAEDIRLELQRLLDYVRTQPKEQSTFDYVSIQLEKLQAEAERAVAARQAIGERFDGEPVVVESQPQFVTSDIVIPELQPIRYLANKMAIDSPDPNEKVNVISSLITRLDDAADTAEQTLLEYLANWGDRGPHGFGDHD